VKAVPFHFCKNIRTLSFKIGIPRSTIQRAMKLGLIKSSKNSIKPILTPKNKLDRVYYCHSFVQDNSFVDMLDCVDIDEKWFYPPIHRCPIVSPSAVLSRRRRPSRTRHHRPSCIDFHHTGNHQNAAVALLGLFQEGTADDELIVGLDSLSIGDADDNSMEDPLTDGDATDGNAADGNAADGDATDGDMEDGEATMNGLRQMGQRLLFDILESFFDDFACDIEWGGEEYDETSLFDETGLASDLAEESADESGMTAGQEAAEEEEE
jgi:hypothetical protein